LMWQALKPSQAISFMPMAVASFSLASLFYKIV
jgi:hypothetical protein